jgi:hypothetical protein
VVCALALLSFMPWTDFRYLMGLLPVCCLLFALVLDRFLTVHLAIGSVFCIFAISTNTLSLTLAPREIRSDLAMHVGSLSHEYVGPNRGIVDYLAAHGQADDQVLTSYGQLPIIFHTGMRAVGFQQDLRLAEDPDWIIVRNGRPGRSYLLSRAHGYREIELQSPDLRWGNRPDPRWQRIRRVEKAPRVILYRKPDLPEG